MSAEKRDQQRARVMRAFSKGAITPTAPELVIGYRQTLLSG
jgi:hypothetical protein